MMRRPDWLERLSEVIARHEASAFSWSSSHCFALVMDAAIGMTGEDPFAGAWRVTSERQAGRELARRRCRDVGDALATAYEEIAPAFARTGDAVTVPGLEGAPVCGLVLGEVIAVRLETGLARLPRARAARAFRIG